MIKLVRKIVGISLIALGLAGCGSSAYDYRKVALIDTIVVPLKKTVQAEHAGFSVTFDKIEQDSRCAINARCTWSGVGIVNATVVKGEQSKKITLSTVNYETFNNTEKAFGKDIQLLELLPKKAAGSVKPDITQITIKLKID